MQQHYYYIDLLPIFKRCMNASNVDVRTAEKKSSSWE